MATASQPSAACDSDLSRLTIREAILTVLTEAKPKPVQVRELARILEKRGKKVQGGPSVDLTTLKQAGEVLNPS
jgi:predicted Zn-ribbon and HTH transcriptional regulator